ncbi:MAG TPA: sugar transferase, partial [Dermatophilaceae bacterium]|nr:sugar transferase [Dermatophilaceae bacterium]
SAALPPADRTAAPPRASAARTGNFTTVSRQYVRNQVIVDGLTGLATFGVTNALARPEIPYSPRMLLLTLAGAVIWPLLIMLCSGYRRRNIGVGAREIRAVFQAGAVLIVLGAYPAAALRQEALLSLVLITTPLCVAVTLVARFIFRKWLHAQQQRGVGCRRTLAVGPLDAVTSLRDGLDSEPHCGIRIDGACLPVSQRGSSPGVAVMGDLGDVRDVVLEHGFEAVAVAGGQYTNQTYLRQLAWSLEGIDVELLVAPGLVEVAGPRLHIRPLIGVPLLHVDQPRFSGWPRLLKRTTDVVFTSLGLLLLAPLLIIVALAVKLQDGGPVFFRQVRIGRNGEPFELLKFRSMVVDAEARKAELMHLNEGQGSLFKLRRDPRVTRIGQFLRDWSIDELPQLINVLQGSMSLVGPRPHLADELAAMPADASRRSLVTPGLTGLWQISGRSDLSGGEGIRLDLRYVENWSLTLDLLVLWKTGRAVLSRAGAR